LPSEPNYPKHEGRNVGQCEDCGAVRMHALFIFSFIIRPPAPRPAPFARGSTWYGYAHVYPLRTHQTLPCPPCISQIHPNHFCPVALPCPAAAVVRHHPSLPVSTLTPTADPDLVCCTPPNPLVIPLTGVWWRIGATIAGSHLGTMRPFLQETAGPGQARG
jgi:hypothetical protein